MSLIQGSIHFLLGYFLSFLAEIRDKGRDQEDERYDKRNGSQRPGKENREIPLKFK
jgi:hypothetical protein